MLKTPIKLVDSSSLNRLSNSVNIACGNEDWQMLPFCLDAQSGIVSDCENAKEYRKLIGLQI